MRRIAWAVFLLLDVLLLLAFAVGYAARYLHPRFAWWAALVAVGLPYVSLLLIPAALPAAVARRWLLLGVHLFFLVLAALRFVPLERGAAPSDDDLTLMTFNTSRGGGASAEAQSRAVTDLVRDEVPDLACFQELNLDYATRGGERFATRLTGLTDSLGYRVVEPRPTESGPAWQPVLGRVTILDQSQQNLPGGGTRIVRVRFRWQDREAVLYNLHLHTFGTPKPWEEDDPDPFSLTFWRTYLVQYRAAYRARAREAEHIRGLLAEETLPVLICGDLNSTPHDWAFAQLAAGMQDVFKKTGREWGATYHTRLPFARIDHVLAGPEWDVVSAHIGNETLSDHRPLVVRLRWRE